MTPWGRNMWLSKSVFHKVVFLWSVCSFFIPSSGWKTQAVLALYVPWVTVIFVLFPSLDHRPISSGFKNVINWTCSTYWYVDGKIISIFPVCLKLRRSHWPHGLWHRPAAARLLGLRIRIPPRHGCLSVVSVVCCQVGDSAMSWSLVQRNPTDCDASLCVIWNLKNEEVTTHVGPLSHKKKTKIPPY